MWWALIVARSMIGGPCALFLAYVSIGGAVALGIAEPYNVDQSCWPHYTALGIVMTDCADPIADGAWSATVETARYLVVVPTLSLAQFIQVARTGSTHWLPDAIAWGMAGAPILIASIAGFFYWRLRVRFVGWILLALLFGQMAIELAPHVTGNLVEDMDEV